MAVQLGAFFLPSHPPRRGFAEGHRWDLEQVELIERLGFAEAWFGEHYTAQWEPSPAPDLIVAQALMRTETIRLGPLGHLLPYHHPVELAHRVAYLDHLAGGRYQLGVGISALPTDRQLFAVPGGGVNRDMTFESLDIMLKLWAEGPGAFDGRFWRMGELKPPPGLEHLLAYHMRPLQQPHPPIAIAGLTPGSPNHERAGAEGYLPVSLTVAPDGRLARAHWDAVENGASSAARMADRGNWRLIRDVFVADTDVDARRLARESGFGEAWRSFLLPLYLGLGMAPLFKTDPEMADSDIDLDYVLDRVCWIGSPDSVAERLLDEQAETGGFGHLTVTMHDCADDPEPWNRSLTLLAGEVLPKVQTALA